MINDDTIICMPKFTGLLTLNRHVEINYGNAGIDAIPVEDVKSVIDFFDAGEFENIKSNYELLRIVCGARGDTVSFGAYRNMMAADGIQGLAHLIGLGVAWELHPHIAGWETYLNEWLNLPSGPGTLSKPMSVYLPS